MICAGLDLDYRSIPFGHMPQLLAIADEVMKINAICTVCGAPATRSQRIVHKEGQVVLGEKDSYEARCRAHYEYEEDEVTQLPLQVEHEAFLKISPINVINKYGLLLP